MRVVLYDSANGSLGVQYLVAVLNQAGHEALVCYDTSLSREYLAKALPFRGLFSIGTDLVCREIMGLRPDLIGFSMNSFNYAESLVLVKRLKRQYPRAVVVCGGVHVTLLPHEVLRNPEVDFAVVGEGERALTQLADSLSKSSLNDVKALPPEMLPGVWSVSRGTVVDRGIAPLVTDLDTLPFPDKSAYERANPAFNRVYSIAASRGCLYGCTYCNSPSTRALYRTCGAGFHRVRSVDNIIAELRAAMERHRPRHVEFFDDLFGAELGWLREFSAAYKKEIGLPYGIETNSLLLDDERLALLAESGCAVLEVGLQSANEQVRKTILNRHETNAKVHEVITRARALGIFVELDFIVDLPGETPEHLSEILEFIRQSRPNLTNISFLQYFPRTRLLEKAVEEGRISQEQLLRIENGEAFGSLRLPQNRRLQYRLFPYHDLFARILPPALSRLLSRIIELPGIRFVFGLIGSPAVYVVRVWTALSDRRAYYLHWHLVRAFHAAKRTLRRKIWGGAKPHPPVSGT